MNTTAAPRFVLLLKSGPGTGTSIAHKGGYALYGNPPRWRKITADKPAPIGAPVAAHPKSAGHHEPAAHFSDEQWAALKLPDSNVNAPRFNKALDKLRAWSDAGDVTAIVGAGYGSNTYAVRLVKLANHLLGLHGSAHKVVTGQKPGAHAASQVAEPADPHPTGLPEHLAPRAAKPEPAPAPDAEAPEPAAEQSLAEKIEAAGFKAHVNEQGKTYIGSKNFDAPKVFLSPEKANEAVAKLKDAGLHAYQSGAMVQIEAAPAAVAAPAPTPSGPEITSSKNFSVGGVDFVAVKKENVKGSYWIPAVKETGQEIDHQSYSSIKKMWDDLAHVAKITGGKFAQSIGVKAAPPAAPSGPLTMPAFEEGKTTTGAKDWYEKLAQKVIDHGHAGNASVLEDMKAAGLKPNAKGKVSNTWAGKTANSKKLLALHADAVAHAGGGAAHAAAAEPTKAKLPPHLVSLAAKMDGNQPGATVTDVTPAGYGPEPGPKEGDTKPGADGATLVLKDGHWVKQGGEVAPSVDVTGTQKVSDPIEGTHHVVSLSNGQNIKIGKLNSAESMGLPGWHNLDAPDSKSSYLADTKEGAISALKAAAKPAAKAADTGNISAQQLLNLHSIPWFKRTLPDTNTNAKPHNAAVAKIEAMAFAGDVAGLKAFAEKKAGAKQTYSKKQYLLAMSVLDFLSGTGPTPEQKVRAAKVADGGPAADTPIHPNVKATIDGMSKDESVLEAVVANNEHNPHVAAYAASKLAALKASTNAAPTPAPVAGPESLAGKSAWEHIKTHFESGDFGWSQKSPDSVVEADAAKWVSQNQADAEDVVSALTDLGAGHLAKKFKYSQADLTPAPTIKPLDHGELNIPGKTNGINADLDKYKAAQAAQKKSEAKSASEKKKTEKAEAKELFAQLGQSIIAKMVPGIAKKNGLTEKQAAKEIHTTLDGLVKWEPSKFLQIAHKFQAENVSAAPAADPYPLVNEWKAAIVAGKVPTKAQAEAFDALSDHDPDAQQEYFLDAVADAIPKSVPQHGDDFDAAYTAASNKVHELHGHALAGTKPGAAAPEPAAPTPAPVKPMAANMAGKFWASPKGPTKYKGKAFAVTSADGKLALAKIGSIAPMAWNAKNIADNFVQSANESVTAGTHHWVPLYASVEEAKGGAPAAPVEQGPKEGDTKQGADGMLVLKNGHWVKVEAAAPAAPAINKLTPGQVVKIMASVNVKTAPGNKGVLKALAVAGDVAGLQAWLDANGKKMPASKLVAKKLLEAMTGGAPIPAPAASVVPPTAPATVGGMLSMDGWAQTGGQGGSNPGGKFKDPSGQEWYCKWPDDAEAAKSEVLAAKLYALAGLSSQDCMLVSKGGKTAIATKWVDIKKAPSASALAKADGAQSGFAVDAWLGNWDVVGLGYDNLQIGPDGKAHRVDAGGSLEYRAQGEKKPFGSKVDELDTLLDAGKNPQAASVFKGMTTADLTASAAKVLAISDVAIRAMVNQYGPGDAAAKAKLAETLIARKADLAKRFPAAVKKKKAPVFKPEDVLPPPSFLNWGGSGVAGPSSKDFLNKANEEAVQAIFAAAKTGSVAAIQGLKAKVYNKDTGALVGESSVLTHPSQHVKGYAEQTVNGINYQLNPPRKFRFDGGHPLHSLSALYPANPGPSSGAAVQKLGKFIVMGEPGVVKLEEAGLPAKILHSEGGGSLSVHTYSKQAQASIAKMPATQKQAITAYTGPHYKKMNQSLWAGNPTGAAAVAAEALKTLSHDIEPGTVLSRKLTLEPNDLKQLLAASGKILKEPAIMSTSIRPSSWHGNVQMKLHVGPGVKGLWVGHHSIPGGGALSANSGEDEMILPPGTRLMIIGVKNGADADGFGKSPSHVVEAIILPTE